MTKITTLADSASLLFAMAPSPGGAGQGSAVPQLVMMACIFGAMYFFMIAPQRKKQKEHQKMLENLDSGDEVVTVGGIYAEITNKKSDRFTLRIADGVKIEVIKSAIQTVVRKAGEEKK